MMFPSTDTQAIRVPAVTEDTEAHPEEESHLGKDTCKACSIILSQANLWLGTEHVYWFVNWSTYHVDNYLMP